MFLPDFLSTISTTLGFQFELETPSVGELIALIFVYLLILLALALATELFVNLIKDIFLPKKPTIKQANVQAAIQGLITRVPEPEQLAQNPQLLSRIRQLLDNHFSEAELSGVCFDLGINYKEELEGDAKDERIQALITYVLRHSLWPRLMDLIQRKRPQVNWETVKAIPIESRPGEDIALYLESLNGSFAINSS